LGGYDEGLDIWGGEQYELSFKIWQCGGRMLDAPCSRVGHVYRGYVPFSNPRKTDYLTRNFKRVAEVWMDEYAQNLYSRYPEKYNQTDAGDLTKQKAIRRELKCKPFKWFIETVAFDLVEKYPPVEPPDFASGALQSLSNPAMCVDTLGKGKKHAIGLFQCATNMLRPQHSQFFRLSYQRDVREKHDEICWDVHNSQPNAEVMLFTCHGMQGNQLWKYDYVRDSKKSVFWK
jgi:polypeptide N-acetylgalactosaminyltransferase